MRKLVPLLILTTLLSACSFLGIGSSANTPKDGDTVSVHYVGTHDDGTEFDSSRREGRTPLQFVIGTGNMIQGFENAVKGMNVGETKKVHIEAKDAYGEEYIIPAADYKEVITQTIPANALTGKLEQKLPKEQAQNVFGSTEAGTEKKIGEATLKILSVAGEEVLVSIDDPKAPFYGKVLAADMTTVAQDGSDITIKKIDGENVEVDIKQKQETISKDDQNVTVKIKNPHPLAGKALNFDIELLDIKSPATTPTA